MHLFVPVPVDMRRQIDGLSALVAIHWPQWFDGNTLCLNRQQLDHLLDGYNLNGMGPHHALQFA